MFEIVVPKIECGECTENYGRFVAEPLEPGFGTTLGNALRRILLSSLPGAAITWVKIEQAQHEFSTIPHLKEDIIELLLNIKQVRLRAFSDRPGKLRLEAVGEGEIHAGDIQPSADFEIANPELYLAILDSEDARLTVEFNVELGKGYVPAGHTDGLAIGVIPVDAIFTPIRRVNYTVEKTRIGQVSDYDRLILEVWTDGTISATEAVSRSAEILVNQLSLFRDLVKAPPRALEKETIGRLDIPAELYDMPIEQLNLSVRTYNCLKRSGINRLGQILEMKEEDLLKVKNFGQKSLQELREKLQSLGLIQTPEESRPEESEPEEAKELPKVELIMLDKQDKSDRDPGVDSSQGTSTQSTPEVVSGEAKQSED